MKKSTTTSTKPQKAVGIDESDSLFFDDTTTQNPKKLVIKKKSKPSNLYFFSHFSNFKTFHEMSWMEFVYTCFSLRFSLVPVFFITGVFFFESLSAMVSTTTEQHLTAWRQEGTKLKIFPSFFFSFFACCSPLILVFLGLFPKYLNILNMINKLLEFVFKSVGKFLSIFMTKGKQNSNKKQQPTQLFWERMWTSLKTNYFFNILLCCTFGFFAVIFRISLNIFPVIFSLKGNYDKEAFVTVKNLIASLAVGFFLMFFPLCLQHGGLAPIKKYIPQTSIRRGDDESLNAGVGFALGLLFYMLLKSIDSTKQILLEPFDVKILIQIFKNVQNPSFNFYDALLLLAKNNAPFIIAFIFSAVVIAYFCLLLLAYYWRALEHKKKEKIQNLSQSQKTPELTSSNSSGNLANLNLSNVNNNSQNATTSFVPAPNSNAEETANVINTMPKEEAAKNPNIFTVAIIETLEEVTPFWRVVILSFGVMIQILFLYLMFVAPSPLTRWGNGNFILNHGIALYSICAVYLWRVVFTPKVLGNFRPWILVILNMAFLILSGFRNFSPIGTETKESFKLWEWNEDFLLSSDFLDLHKAFFFFFGPALFLLNLQLMWNEIVRAPVARFLWALGTGTTLGSLVMFFVLIFAPIFSQFKPNVGVETANLLSFTFNCPTDTFKTSFCEIVNYSLMTISNSPMLEKSFLFIHTHTCSTFEIWIIAAIITGILCIFFVRSTSFVYYDQNDDWYYMEFDENHVKTEAEINDMKKRKIQRRYTGYYEFLKAVDKQKKFSSAKEEKREQPKTRQEIYESGFELLSKYSDYQEVVPVQRNAANLYLKLKIYAWRIARILAYTSFFVCFLNSRVHEPFWFLAKFLFEIVVKYSSFRWRGIVQNSSTMQKY